MSAANVQELWPKLRYHPQHALLWQYTGRFAAVVAGRRSGKTEVCKRKTIVYLPIRKPWPNPIYIYLLPTREQAKRVVWYDMLRMIPKQWIPKDGLNRTELSITTVFGSKLYIAGADKPHRIEGLGVDGVVIDESSDQRPGLFGRTIVPMLAERNGWCYRIGVPKRTGIGRVEFREFFNRGQRNEDNIASFHWESADILTPQQLEEAKQQLTEDDFNEQFRAHWLDIGSNVYYNFSNENIRDDIRYDPVHEIIVGCDFNVDPMCWSLMHHINGKLYVFDEIVLRDTNTPKTLDHLFAKYRDHSAGWKFYGDASSRARKTSATKTDYLIIKNDARFGQKKVYFPNRNPHVRDRFASVNVGFRNAKQDVRIYVHVSCKRLINDFNSVSFVEGTTNVEDYSGTDIGHMSDAFGYAVYQIMPIKLDRTSVPEVFLSAAG